MLKPDDYQRNQRVLDLVQIYLASQRGSSATRPNANELIRFHRKQKTLALDIVLTNILGEEDYMHLVQHVKIVDHFEDPGKATPIKHLHNHITNIRE